MTGRRDHGPTVSLWHPFTARSIGWTEDDLIAVHSLPHRRALRDLASERGWRPRVDYLTDATLPRAIVADGLRIRFWPRSPWRRARRAFRAERSPTAVLNMLFDPPDLVIINTSGHGGPLPRDLAVAARRRRRPYVAMIGGLHVTTTGDQLGYFRSAAAIAVHNPEVHESLTAAGIGPEKVVDVPLGTDTEVFCPPDRPTSDPTVLFVGRVVPWKGIDRLIEAMGEVRGIVPSARLEIVGPEPDANHSAALRRLVEEHQLGDAVRFRGPVAHAELPDRYRAAAVLVVPNAEEGFGMVVVESMACGTPVIALDGPGGPRRIITAGTDGELVTPAQLGAAITALLVDDARRRAMSCRARETAVARFSTAATAATFAAFAQPLLAPK